MHFVILTSRVFRWPLRRRSRAKLASLCVNRHLHPEFIELLVGYHAVRILLNRPERSRPQSTIHTLLVQSAHTQASQGNNKGKEKTGDRPCLSAGSWRPPNNPQKLPPPARIKNQKPKRIRTRSLPEFQHCHRRGFSQQL